MIHNGQYIYYYVKSLICNVSIVSSMQLSNYSILIFIDGNAIEISWKYLIYF